jgi:hypothetical protein
VLGLALDNISKSKKSKELLKHKMIKNPDFFVNLMYFQRKTANWIGSNVKIG